ncbi:hypothetical protein PPERSA_08009 [Pseudocohnilembus persalinus]|uniref:IC97/Casc1 N-terminal domain-containing protein n=1 Tax=Pseudocohnilembus persalinus TaxID=266149 RepID=A0A0V0R2Z1_PSEPJ|nr:hypothetical protein PPERSA_08009 [Pseudocohnilembus persalinus]|eukprot:KRX08698.1 hypothetical protein PPERSA_08009 [Pseudocohnilembus persalinus]
MERINKKDITAHDRTVRPLRPNSSNKQQQQKNVNSDNQNPLSSTMGNNSIPGNRNNSQAKKTMKINSYMKSKNNSVSTDTTSIKSFRQPNNTVAGGNLTKRGSSQNSHKQKNHLISQVQTKKVVKKKKPKKNKKDEKILLDLEEQKRQEEEEQREFELYQFRLAQQQKLSEEEKQRLEEEYGFELDFQQKFESEIFQKQKIRQQYENWQNYVNCKSKPDPNKENQMNEFLFIFGENNVINNFDVKKQLEKFDYSESIINDLNQSVNTAMANNQHEKIGYYQNFINKIREIQNKKILEITAYHMKNQQHFIDEQNKIIQEHNLPLLNGDNLKQISSKINSKQELRNLYEFQQQHQSDKNKFGLWFNPVYKAGARLKSVKFEEFKTSIEVPRIYQEQLVIRYTFFRQDNLSGSNYQKYNILGGVHTFSLFKFFPLPVIRARFIMQRDYNSLEEICQEQFYPQPHFQGNQQFIMISLPIANDVYINKENLKIGYFHNNDKKWVQSDEQIQIVKIEEDIVLFKTQILAPFAFISEKQQFFPYKNWFLRQISSWEALLDIQTQDFTFKFEFNTYFVKLRRSMNLPILEDIFDKEMDISELLLELKNRGFNFLPQDIDSSNPQYIQYKKQPDIENKAIQEIITILPSFMVKSHPDLEQNKVDPQADERIFIQIKENMEYLAKDVEEQQGIDTWDNIGCWYKKVGMLKKGNFNEIQDNTQTHVSLDLIFQNHPQIISEEAYLRISNMLYPELQNNIRIFFKLTKLASFT